MIMIRTRAVAASLAPLARTALVASLVGCSSSSNNAGPAAQDGGIDASTASDGSVTDTGAAKAGRKLELTWQVVAGGPSPPYVGYDGGGAGAGGGVDAGSDEAGADASTLRPTQPWRTRPATLRPTRDPTRQGRTRPAL